MTEQSTPSVVVQSRSPSCLPRHEEAVCRAHAPWRESVTPCVVLPNNVAYSCGPMRENHFTNAEEHCEGDGNHVLCPKGASEHRHTPMWTRHVTLHLNKPATGMDLHRQHIALEYDDSIRKCHWARVQSPPSRGGFLSRALVAASSTAKALRLWPG